MSTAELIAIRNCRMAVRAAGAGETQSEDRTATAVLVVFVHAHAPRGNFLIVYFLSLIRCSLHLGVLL